MTGFFMGFINPIKYRINIYIHTTIQKITNKNLLYSTKNYTQNSVIT